MKPIAIIPGRYLDNAMIAAIDAAVGKRRRSTRLANLGSFTGYRVGYDIGNGNIGWCILFEEGLRLTFMTAEDIHAHNAALPKAARRTQLPDLENFVPLGTYKFTARNPDGESFSSVKAKNRARMGMLDARQNRRLHLRLALQEAKLLPPGRVETTNHPSKTNHPRKSADALRVLLLNSKCQAHPHDLGRALYNALFRRGFMKPIGRAGADEDSGFGEQATTTYREALKRHNC